MPSALNCCVVLTVTVALAGVTVIELRMGVTIKVCDPVTPDMLAEMVVVPLLRPVARPALIEATLVELEDHVATLVRFLLDPSLYEPVAVNCAFPFTGMDCPAEVTVIDRSIAVCVPFLPAELPALLPQPTIIPIKNTIASAKVAFQIENAFFTCAP